MAVMKTSARRNQEERGPHGRYEDLGEEKSGGERSSWPL